MTYDRTWLIEFSVKAIQEHNISSVDQLLEYIPIKKSQFYHAGYHKEIEISEAIWMEVAKKKTKIKRKLEDSDNPALIAMWYKLHATEDELKRLGTQYQKISGDNDEPAVKMDIDINKLSKDELRAMDALITKATRDKGKVSE
jgi:hypothetical protein